jgi:hypothetical protein
MTRRPHPLRRRRRDPRGAADGQPLPPNVCTACGYCFNAAASLNDAAARPTVGDVSICIACGQVALFVQGLLLDAIPPEELDSFFTDPEARRTLAGMLLVILATRRAQWLWYCLLYWRLEAHSTLPPPGERLREPL